jgi:replicative DNA helicase
MIARPSEEWARLVAHSVPIEQAVLGACILYPDAHDVIGQHVTGDDFAEPVHRLLYTKLSAARSEGRNLDIGLLRAALGDDAKVDLGGVSLGDYVGRLMHQAPIAMAVREHARSLRECADIRRIYSQADLLRERAGRGLSDGSPREIAIDAIAALDAIIASHLPEHLRRVSAGEAAASVLETMDRAIAGEKAAWGAPYGVGPLDVMTRGLHRGHLTIVAARPSMGKSAFGVCAALASARAGHAVQFVSLEMSAQELSERAISNLAFDHRSPISYTSIRSGDLGVDHIERVRAAADMLARLPVEIEQQRGLSPSQIVARCRSGAQALERRGKRLGVVIVDHLGKVRPSDRYAGNRTTELGEITGAMKDMAGELDCAVMVLCQLNRQTEQRDNKRPVLGDLRESGRIEEDADNVLLLYREAYYRERAKNDGESAHERSIRIGEVEHDMEIIVAKQRQGETGIVDAWCSMPCNVITGRG